jgi:thiol:disulfide interchange protein
MRTLPLFAAVVLALPTIGVDLVLPDQQARALLTVLLAAIAGIYVGFALMDGRARILVLEASIALAFVLLATLGAQESLLLLALGYIGHGVWDLAHHPNYVPTRLVPWYPPFCALYDWLIAAFILVRWVF